MARQKLSKEQIAAIRFSYKTGGVSLRILGRMYKVSHVHIRRIVKRPAAT